MELRDYIQVIRARKWVIIQAVVIVTLVALVVSLVLPKTYEGTAQVLITETDSASAILGSVVPLSAQPERALLTQAQLMSIRPIAETTIKRLNLQVTPTLLMKSVNVAAVGQTNIVQITATNEDPALAAKIANTNGRRVCSRGTRRQPREYLLGSRRGSESASTRRDRTSST